MMDFMQRPSEASGAFSSPGHGGSAASGADRQRTSPLAIEDRPPNRVVEPGCLKADPKKGNLQDLQAEIAAAMQPRAKRPRAPRSRELDEEGMGEEMEEEKELEVGDEAEAPDQEEGQEGKAPSVCKRPAAVLKRPATSPAGATPKAARGPYYGIEWTRNQIVCRTGIPGRGQTCIFKFQTESDRKVAQKKAQSWCDDAARTLGYT